MALPSEPAVVAVHPKNSVASRSGELSGMIKSMVDPVGSTSASKESAIVAFGEAQRAALGALQPFFVPKFDEERGSAHRLTSALLLKYTSERHL